jgi:hypothetical protein
VVQLTILPNDFPLQGGSGLRRDLEQFARRKALHPKNDALGGGSQPAFASLGRWDFSIDEKILEFCWDTHAQGLKTIARSPTPDHDPFPDTIGVQLLGVLLIAVEWLGLTKLAPMNRGFFDLDDSLFLTQWGGPSPATKSKG